LKAYNTDWIGIYNFLLDYKYNHITVLGNGGFSKAVQFAFDKLNITSYIITRKEWNEIPKLDGIIFNATPVNVITSGKLIDGRPFTEDGKKIALFQAEEQYKIYING
jgi:shikimate 5-dehydrogenase